MLNLTDRIQQIDYIFRGLITLPDQRVAPGGHDPVAGLRIDLRLPAGRGEKILRQVNTTRDYAVQVWPTALAQATAARDDVLALTYSWEYYIRVEVQKEEKDPITETWKREDEAMPTLDLSKYYKRGNTAPGTMKARFDSDVASIKSAIKLGAFVAAYRRAIDQGVEAKDLPGGKPPSAPSDD